MPELIITGGFNVYPREVELVLEQHPLVAEVAVVGIPSERWGEEVTAFVVARKPVKPEELIAFARERLSTYKCPRVVSSSTCCRGTRWARCRRISSNRLSLGATSPRSIRLPILLLRAAGRSPA